MPEASEVAIKGDHVIRVASDDELERLSEFFQEELISGGSYHVAVKGRFNRIIGFLCMTYPEAHPSAARFRWRIVRGYEGSAVERGLIESAITQTEAGGATELETLDMLRADSPGDRLLDSLGFTVTRWDDLYEVDLASVFNRAKSARARLARRGDVPPEAAVVALDAHNWDAVARLALRHGLLPFECLSATVEQSGFTANLSGVLTLGSTVCGGLLAKVRGRVAEIAAMVVDPVWRSGTHWANTLLSESLADRATAAGVELLRFRCHPTMSREIQNLARRCAGRLIARQHARAYRWPTHA